MSDDTLRINEIFYSIQGESTWAGAPCVFVRLTGCHLRCRYCDTEYAFYEGAKWTLDQVHAEVDRLAGADQQARDPRSPRLSAVGPEANARSARPIVEITGGEPLLQPNVHPLMRRLADTGYTVLVETSGACEIAGIDERVIRILDLKTPGSGEAERNHWPNLDALTDRDQVKFVLTDRADYEWARDVVRRSGLADRVAAVLMSPAHETAPGAELPGVEGLSLHDLAQWVLEDRLPVQVQTQLHKLIWHPEARGV